MAFDSVDRHTEEGLERWRAAGSPPIPSIAIDGVTTTIMHISQVARLLDLPVPPTAEPTRVGYDIALLLASWDRMVARLPPDAVVAPTASRGRSLRNLTMNAVYPISLLPEARATGDFDWGLVDLDEERAQPYVDAASLASFVRGVHDAWSSYLVGNEDDLEAGDPCVATPRGRMRYSELLGHQRWHLAFHQRQVVGYLQSLGVAVPDEELALPDRLGVDLPDVVV